MASQVVVNEFLELLEKSELLSPAQFRTVVEKYGLRDKPSGFEAARELVVNGVLSKFQADRLMQGRYRGFFVDHFKILEILGVGGMGWVYTAQDRQTGQVVALKVLSEHNQHVADMQARMKLEVRAGLMLDHENIVHAYKAEHSDEVDYLVTEYVQGITLQELIELNGPLSIPQACDFVCQIAAGLQHASERGLVHRDIKPANVLVDHSGNVKILDFGLALIEDDEDEFSLAMIFGHDCLGTDDFIPPEQIRASYSVDGRADVYSLGCTLYFLLSKTVPFPLKSTPEKLRAHLTQQARPLRELVPELPEQVAAIVEKMMAKLPADRFQTAGEVREALLPFAEKTPVVFDFPAMLVERCKDAQRRFTNYKEKRRREASSASSIARRRLAGSSGYKPTSMMDTGIPGETRPRHSAISLDDPLETIRKEAHRKKPSVKKSPSSSPKPTPQKALGRLVPDDGGVPILLTKKRILIGHHDECEIWLSDKGISGRHCELTFDGQVWRVRDLDSKNGIQVNGRYVKEQILRSGDKLTLARVRTFQLQTAGDKSKPSVDWVSLFGGAAAGLLALALWWLLTR